VPFFWSQHYDVRISYVGHASSWDGLEVIGDLIKGNACGVFRRGRQIMAVATVGRDRVSLAAEAALEQNDLKSLEVVLKAQQ